jgi:hypothetical protein
MTVVMMISLLATFFMTRYIPPRIMRRAEVSPAEPAILPKNAFSQILFIVPFALESTVALVTASGE